MKKFIEKGLVIMMIAIMTIGTQISVCANEVDRYEDDQNNIPEELYASEYNDLDVFVINGSVRGRSEPSDLWNLDTQGICTIYGSTEYGNTLYSEYYFNDVVGRKLSLRASSNTVKVDLVHKGTLIQTVVSTWYVPAGGTIYKVIGENDLGGYDENDNYYFRFNSNPMGNKYSIHGTIG